MKSTVSDLKRFNSAEKIQNLIIFFSLIKNDITQNELNLIDGAIVRTYKTSALHMTMIHCLIRTDVLKNAYIKGFIYNELLSKDKTKTWL